MLTPTDASARRTGRFGVLLARSGWALGGVLGMVISVAYSGSDGLLAESGVAGVLGSKLVLLPVGAAPGVLIGLIVQYTVRAWQDSAVARESASVGGSRKMTG